MQKHIQAAHWELTLPGGWGHETYFARGEERVCFVKLGAQIPRYQVLAALGLTPPVWADGKLEDGTSILVQPLVEGHSPSRADFRIHLERIATILARVHDSPALKQLLPEPASRLHRDAGMEALADIRRRWERHRAQVPEVAGFVDESLDQLARELQGFTGNALAASHNDICNGNWLVSSDGPIYLIDLESMSMEDPAVDAGALLWWYYPPDLRPRFLDILGHANDEDFQRRMRVRMAMHCLHITLPREQGFDEFDPASYAEALTDFRAILAGEENPQGYED
ncbi:MAG: phosphotransferase [Chloroflexota bacterium]